MKPSVSPHMVALLVLSVIAPASAQNLSSGTRSQEIGKADVLNGQSEQGFENDASLPCRYEVPTVLKAEANLSSGNPVYAAQDSLTLDTKAASERKVEAVVDLGILRNPSPYRKVLVSTAAQPSEIAAGTLQDGLARISAVYRETGKAEASEDCLAVSLSLEQRIKLDTAKVLEVVESEVAANPGCACEIVKTSIKASEADVSQYVSIVETAIQVTPDSMRMISQCAIAAMPESVSAVQALLTKLDPNSGDADVYSSKSAKSAKSAKVAAISAPPLPNPLDLPPAYPPIPPIIPPQVTDVDPCVGYNDKY